MVSKTEKRVLEVIGKNGVNDKVAPSILGKNYFAVAMHKTRVYKRFLEHLDIMIDYYPIFEKRLETDPLTYTKLRKLAQKIRP